MFMTFGPVRFAVMTVMGAGGGEKWEYAEHKRIAGKPVLHFRGEGLDSITLRIRFERSFIDPDQGLAALRKVAKKAQSHELVYGYGGTEGNYVITGMQRTVRKSDPDGRARLVDVTVTFKEDANDEDGRPRATATRSAQGIKRNRPTPPNEPADSVTPDKIVRR